jgi:hypothetical protein
MLDYKQRHTKGDKYLFCKWNNRILQTEVAIHLNRMNDVRPSNFTVIQMSTEEESKAWLLRQRQFQPSQNQKNAICSAGTWPMKWKVDVMCLVRLE